MKKDFRMNVKGALFLMLVELVLAIINPKFAGFVFMELLVLYLIFQAFKEEKRFTSQQKKPTSDGHR
ncbi:hypothetical protein ACOYX0_11020 [Enterococcus thailandicus]|jgi:hypothetical protein|uniref:hypothetical protein n=1 Tax=Enterococcus TaxID=1350 RepID=UPI0022E45C69|nr:hypothetical protein [Enterococcus thailandicus]MDA3973259.1 hypothetical protein [Enterococcus thailandicus]MDA3976155.1 hypothetical protein [Enterococcus thailandicus]MDA3980719.1 hypothetical protein [Enterococcus thailandicus]MDT2735449.1 hypothetical protein [Enterococcus thailandicus]MDT2753152.1 hypothetical protein [Enterococcus thailandicus]